MIRLVDLEKTYKAKMKEHTVLNKVNLTVEKGEMLAIMGRSGVGKSTLLHILAGLEKETSGKYYFQDKDITKLSYRELAVFRKNNIGFILQNHALIEEKNIFDNIALPLLYGGNSKKEIRSKVLTIMQELGLEDKTNQYPSELSGGESQRVAIARALINDPDVILADEPTGSLDEDTEQIILNLFKQINKLGKTFILVTHDETVAHICNRVIKIKDGDIHYESIE
ncbi:MULTISPECIES: ABC transporter ATP-binding protein [Bacillus cereus group]|uniref:ABC transporter, ATP-binding protein n=1 Tax=Bacillus thuringiensis subsp. konkukian (strain 97-27) TaxID=281309 RepID=Q6HKJ3_BACHK|nr:MULTISPECIES: ABC transporter ATP-binding protein [Bacillus cereus group]AAT59552.1 ABC transporter, ATP-binding protein [[Bacillus thuringiensis] serovar konkukian str. 97-27]AJI35420.1 ABC transporter family protein [Bacillus thuringiensis]MDA2314399.1 ABC transporter ATP-binding protein [Bacillus cereus]MDA2319921.1 ABC transporter ATP-binding protein [Bacillus cereus]MDA2503289.1 ABC transporter ATP-binding protein [Bacillus cereus]